ncbi:MAG: NO-inducible flavohemoprotein [Deinococcus sp.]|uniref:NO-inducible flavohemoprotein n=1 Tax=Deinococcus sp. TaxID=47478 RepID=UPI0026DBC041|nr:NO-inducible flavohemoprotein [Deinococcus sp.]MDO4246555.1 NO-inducible flavohemoprotein [Deinococcus sp.]
MLTPEQKTIVKATVPALEAHGETITRTFYASMFAAHPELLNIFNPANQKTGKQARSLAASVLAYAAHIDHPEVLGGMVGRIAHKHVSLEVRAEHYPIVGKHLLGAIAEVLGDAATPEILDAWAAAYGELADLMIGVEQGMYDAGAEQKGGWRDFRPFRVARKLAESSVITSFVLEPVDGQPLPAYQPGQYLSLKVKVPGQENWQIRQYSLSDAPSADHYRISVKREAGGLISGHLHDTVQEGDELLVHVPAGDFVLQDSERPVVLLSGGVGITPVLAMLHSLIRQGSSRPVTFVHAAQNGSVHAFRDDVNALASQYPHVRKLVFYTDTNDSDQPGTHHDAAGLIHLDALRPVLPQGDAEYYYCGPSGFVAAVEGILDELKVPAERRFTETFGPSQSFDVVIHG